MCLQQPADREHDRGGQQHRQEGVQPGQADHGQDQIGGKDDQVAMCQIDQPHDPEDKAQPCGEKARKARPEAAPVRGCR
jgi:endonuclease YncB( thermonuclease family)